MTEENQPGENPELEIPTEEQSTEGVAFATDSESSADVIQKASGSA